MQNVGKRLVPANVMSLCGEALWYVLSAYAKLWKATACVVTSVNPHETNRLPL